VTGEAAPTHWLRQRAGDPGTIKLSATEAAMIAQRPGAKGDYMSTAGLVWRERDPDARGGWAYYTITPVFGEAQ
jgi:hypothetical protein